MSPMEKAFEVLEEKVKRAADAVRSLRKQTDGQQKELGQVRTQLQAALKQVEALEKQQGSSAEDVKRAEELGAEVKSLRAEHDEVKRRVAKLVEVLDGIDG